MLWNKSSLKLPPPTEVDTSRLTGLSPICFSDLTSLVHISADTVILFFTNEATPLKPTWLKACSLPWPGM